MDYTYTFLCVSSYFKGEDFLRACKLAGNRVYLITSYKLRNEDWPWEHIDEVFYMDESESKKWDMEVLIRSVAFQMRHLHFDRFVALDDFDVEKVSALREQFRVPGMGDSTSRYFRDKLAMRVKARLEAVPVPAFTPLFNNEAIVKYTEEISPPWMIKPRAEASAVGIKKISSAEELWQALQELGDNRHKYLLEKFSPGQVFHVDALSAGGKVVFSRVSRYLDTPFDVAHSGGVFRSHTLSSNNEAYKELTSLNKKVLKAFGLQYSASHTEYIRSNDSGEFLFLETSSRVGGAHLAEMVEAASGVNLWSEWAHLETAMARHETYKPPIDTGQHAGIVVSLSRFEFPDTSQFTDEEIKWRLKKKWHVGLIVQAKSEKRVLELLDSYTARIRDDFHAEAPAPKRSP